MNRLIHERETDQIGNYAALETNKLRGTLQVARSKAEERARAKCYLFLTSNLTSFMHVLYIFGGQTFQKESIYIWAHQ